MGTRPLSLWPRKVFRKLDIKSRIQLARRMS
jgi:hypothetical protein